MQCQRDAILNYKVLNILMTPGVVEVGCHIYVVNKIASLEIFHLLKQYQIVTSTILVHTVRSITKLPPPFSGKHLKKRFTQMSNNAELQIYK